MSGASAPGLVQAGASRWAGEGEWSDPDETTLQLVLLSDTRAAQRGFAH